MAQIPNLLQLSAEQVANEAIKNIRIRQYLSHIHLPDITISYLKKSMNFTSCDFSTFIREELSHSAVIPSVAKAHNYEFKLTVGKEKVMYISTIFDLGRDMLKLDFPMGEYGVFQFDHGYVIRKKEYQVDIKDAIHIFNNYSDEKGLAPTYNCYDPNQNVHLLRMFHKFLIPCMHKFRRTFTRFQSLRECDLYNIYNIPVLFYLTEYVNADDLGKITLTCASDVNNCGNVDVCWYVIHSEKGQIGIAIKQKSLYDMLLFAQGGVCLFASNGFRAIGNFSVCVVYTLEDKVNGKIFEPYHAYKCEFNPCCCDFRFAT